MTRLPSISAKRSCERRLLPVKLLVLRNKRKRKLRGSVNFKNVSKIDRLNLTRPVLNVRMSRLRSKTTNKRSQRRRDMKRSYVNYMRRGRSNLLTMISESNRLLNGSVISSFKLLQPKRDLKQRSASRWQTEDKPISLTSNS